MWTGLLLRWLHFLRKTFVISKTKRSEKLCFLFLNAKYQEILVHFKFSGTKKFLLKVTAWHLTEHQCFICHQVRRKEVLFGNKIGSWYSQFDVVSAESENKDNKCVQTTHIYVQYMEEHFWGPLKYELKTNYRPGHRNTETFQYFFKLIVTAPTAHVTFFWDRVPSFLRYVCPGRTIHPK